MGYYVRKIDRAKWELALTSTEGVYGIPLSTFARDMADEKSAISLWKIHEPKELDSICLSLMLSGSSFCKIEVVCIPESEINERFEIVNTPEKANTSLPELSKKHYDLQGLTLKTLGEFFSLIADRIKKGNTSNEDELFCKRITESQLKKEFEGVDIGDLNVEKLSPDMIKSIRRKFSDMPILIKCPDDRSRRKCSFHDICNEDCRRESA